MMMTKAVTKILGQMAILELLTSKKLLYEKSMRSMALAKKVPLVVVLMVMMALWVTLPVVMMTKTVVKMAIVCTKMVHPVVKIVKILNE